MAENVRQAVIETLFELGKTKRPVSAIFEQIGNQTLLNGKDRQLAMKIIYGVLRNRDYLDTLLGQLCRQPLNKIKPYIHHALHCGLYQIFFLDRIPPSAAVNETVKAVQARKFPKPVQGFVNGVLRESIRQRTYLPKPEDPDANGQPILNHPAWLTKRWRKHYGTDTMVRICVHNNREPLLCLRADSDNIKELQTSLEDAGVDVRVGNYAPNSLVVADYHGRIGDIEGIEQGYVQVQDQAAQLATLLLAPFSPNNTYLDGCAGLGGKTNHLISLIDPTTSSITAVEPDYKRFQILRQTLTRPRNKSRVVTSNQYLQEFVQDCSLKFDRILIDAPCSGTGVIGRHPDIRWNRTGSELAHYASRQLELLSKVATLLDSDGVLIYTTCSIEPEENDHVIKLFLERHDDFIKADCGDFLPASCNKFIRNGYFAPLPESGIDGFFGARLTRKKS